MSYARANLKIVTDFPRTFMENLLGDDYVYWEIIGHSLENNNTWTILVAGERETVVAIVNRFGDMPSDE